MRRTVFRFVEMARIHLLRTGLPLAVRAGSTAVITPFYGLLLVALNAYIALTLFGAEYIRQPDSIESSFIAFAAYISRNWGDLSWYPLWYGGMPLHNVYNPVFHFTVATISTITSATRQHAYHLLSGIIYSVAPLTLFYLCNGMTESPGYSFATGLTYSLVSMSALVSPTVMREISSPFHSRRFYTMVRYGEAPHILATLILPLVVLFIHRATVERKPLYFSLAVVSLSGLVLTNWPGAVGLAMALLAYCCSEVGGGRLAWTRLGIIIVVAYLVSCRWIPPSAISLAFSDAQQSDYRYFSVTQILYVLGIVAILILMHVLLAALQVTRFLRFGIYFIFLSGLVTLGRLWFGWGLLPQGHRFQIEMEIALALTGCMLLRQLLVRSSRQLRRVVIVSLLFAVFPIVKSNRRFARLMSESMDMTQTSEYRMAQAFRRLRPKERVFGPGNVSLWMNRWTDTPQVSGCCDQSIPDFEHRISDYTIYTGQNAGRRDAEYSLIWLRAYGATAVGVSGPASTASYKLSNPFKFEGFLPPLWREGDDIIYDIPQRSRSLAHVISRSAQIIHAPEHGLQTTELEKYVSALDNPEFSEARFIWTSQHTATIHTIVKPGQIISIQVSYDPGWSARVNGSRGGQLERDKLGQIFLDPKCSGICRVDLLYDGGAEQRVMAVLQVIGILLVVFVPLWFHYVKSHGSTQPVRNL